MSIGEWLVHGRFPAEMFVLALTLAGGHWFSGDPDPLAGFGHQERRTAVAASPPDAHRVRDIETLEHVRDR